MRFVHGIEGVLYRLYYSTVYLSISRSRWTEFRWLLYVSSMHSQCSITKRPDVSAGGEQLGEKFGWLLAFRAFHPSFARRQQRR